MNYQAFTNDSLVMMHHAAQGALAVDDELNKLGQQARFRVRETLDWVKHAADLEAEMFRRGMIFDGIVWAKQQHSVSDAMAAPQNEVACSPPSPPCLPAKAAPSTALDRTMNSSDRDLRSPLSCRHWSLMALSVKLQPCLPYTARDDPERVVNQCRLRSICFDLGHVSASSQTLLN